jgi:hypothetical protein
MATPKTIEPSPERPNEGSSAVTDALLRREQEAAENALDTLKRYLPAQSHSPSATFDAETPNTPTPSASPESTIVVPPRTGILPAATPSDSAQPAAAPPATEKPKEEGVLQQGLDYVKRMPHEAMLAIAALTAGAWFFSQPKEGDSWMKSALRNVVRYSGLAVLGAWAWQKYAPSLQASEKKPDVDPNSIPDEPPPAAGTSDTIPQSPQAPAKVPPVATRSETIPQSPQVPKPPQAPAKVPPVATRSETTPQSLQAPAKAPSDRMVVGMINGNVILWAGQDKYVITKDGASLESFEETGDGYLVQGTSFGVTGVGRVSKQELIRTVRQNPTGKVRIQGVVRKADNQSNWGVISAALTLAANNIFSSAPKPISNADGSQWQVSTELTFTKLPPRNR